MKKMIQSLQQLGFSQYESQVYLALLQQSNVTGYELAKTSGVPASKIYAILNKLIERQFVLAIDSEPKKYVPVPPEDILSRLKGDYLEIIEDLSVKLDQLYIQQEFAGNYIWNLSGRPLIMRKIQDFIMESAKHIYLSVWDEEVDELVVNLNQAHNRGIKIAVVHFGQKELGIGNEYRHGREHQIRIERGGRRIVLIVDDKKMIIGHFTEDGNSNAVWTENKGLVLLAKDYIIHDIYTIRVLLKYGEEAMDIYTKI